MQTPRLPGAGQKLSWIIALPLLLIVILAGGWAASQLEIGGPACYAYVHLDEDGTWRPGHLTGRDIDRDTWSVDRFGTRPELDGRECVVRVGTR